MQRIKRPHTDIMLDCNNNIIIKKPKLDSDITHITIHTKESSLEDLPNETIYEIFDYLDINDAYEAFFSLNKRFENFFSSSNLLIQVNISTMPRSSFERYHRNIIIPNKHRINYLRLSNPFTVDSVFSPPVIMSEFVRLETLVLDNINAKYLRNIFNHAMKLNQLHSLVLRLADAAPNLTQLFDWILRLPKLKSCAITYPTKDDRYPQTLLVGECKPSSIERLVINSRFRYNSLETLLSRVPNLRYLSIDSLIGNGGLEIYPFCIPLTQLKHVSFKLLGVFLQQLEPLITNCFQRVEFLRLTTTFDLTYLNAQQWEQLIESSMPYLRVFDMNYNAPEDNASPFHRLIKRFTSPFWIQRGWFFTHQHHWQRGFDCGMFYSTDPYRREIYQFYGESQGENCSHAQQKNFNSVRHLHIDSQQLTDTPTDWFPNATELTIAHYFETPDDSIVITLNRFLPLQQLQKLIIQAFDFPFEQIIDLLRYTPHVHTLRLSAIYVPKNSLKFIKQSDTFRHISRVNRIQNVEIDGLCAFDNIRLLLDLFPRMESFQTGMLRREIEQIVRYLFTIKNNHQLPHLFFLRISGVPKICLREIDQLLEQEDLLDNYLIKSVNRDLYLWW